MKNISFAGICALVAACSVSAAAQELALTPYAIPGSAKVTGDAPTGGYAPAKVDAVLNIDVKEGTKDVKVIRDNTDPYVITKPYRLKKADPYAVRSYLEAAVGAKSVRTSPAQATAVKFADGSGLVLVSAEEYRFKDTAKERGIDSIVAALDRTGLTYAPEAGTRIYFPRISRASTLREMLIRVGSSELDPQFRISPDTIMVDGELNALLIRAPQWSWNDMRDLLVKYDRPIPEVRVHYRVLEIYAENDDRIGIDFQSWKNNEGIDLFSAGSVNRRNWGTFFASGVQNTGYNRTSYWNFNPKWNTRYLDFLTSIGKAKVLAKGTLTAQNRITSNIQVNTGFFYDRTYYPEGAQSLAEASAEFTYANPNPETILRESITKVAPLGELQKLYGEAGSSAILSPIGYTLRMMGTQTTTNTYGDISAYLAQQQLAATASLADSAIAAAGAQAMATVKAQYEAKGATPDAATLAAAKAQGEAAATAQVYQKMSTLASTQNDPLATYLTGHMTADGSGKYGIAAWYNNKGAETGEYMNCSPGMIHGWLQYPMVKDGFKFNLNVRPVVTAKAAKIAFNLNSISLLGWNSDGSPRTSNSSVATTVQVGYEPQEFVIGGLRKSETVRGTAGLPFLKDLPVIGRALSTESESIKQSQLVLIARVEYSNPDDFTGADVKEDLGKITGNVNDGMTSRVGNMFFQQYFLDSDRGDRVDRLDAVGKEINDEYKELK